MIPTPRPIVTAEQCYTPRIGKERKAREPKVVPVIDRLFIIDTETATDNTAEMPGFDPERWNGINQRLLFGRTILAERDPRTGIYLPTNEYLFYPDDLPHQGLDLIEDGIGALPLGDHLEPNEPPYTKLYLVSQQQFLDRVFWPEVRRGACFITGFNAIFDLTRIARNAVAARGDYYGGFTLAFWQYRDRKTGMLKSSPFRPQLSYMHLDSKRAFYKWGTYLVDIPPEERDPTSKKKWKQVSPDQIPLDLKTAIYALTSESETLASATKKHLGRELDKEQRHGVITADYLNYNRDDVISTLGLANHFISEHEKHPISKYVAVNRLYSPASLRKAYYDLMGVRQPHG